MERWQFFFFLSSERKKLPTSNLKHIEDGKEENSSKYANKCQSTSEFCSYPLITTQITYQW